MRSWINLIAVLALTLAGLAAPAAAQTTSSAEAPYERYGHIERFKIASSATGRTYTIEIFRPASYAASTRAYPALFMLDGHYGFDAAVALSSYMQRTPNPDLPEYLIIGVSSDVPFGPTMAAVRTPDFTPPTKDGVMTREVVSPYYRFLKDELLPEVERHVRIEPDQKTLWGYSLSGSFATWLNFYDPALFRNYIIASPNWGQFGIQQRMMEGAVFNAPSAAHKLFFSFDVESELGGVPNAEGTIKQIVGAGFPGYRTKYVLTHGESHSSSWMTTLPAALRFVYGPD